MISAKILMIIPCMFILFGFSDFAATQEPFPNSKELHHFIEESTERWLSEKKITFKELFDLSIENDAESLFSNTLSGILSKANSKKLIEESLSVKGFDRKKFFLYTEILTYDAFDTALVFQIYLNNKIRSKIAITEKAIKMVVHNYGCDTPPCDFKFWCGCFYK